MLKLFCELETSKCYELFKMILKEVVVGIDRLHCGLRDASHLCGLEVTAEPLESMAVYCEVGRCRKEIFEGYLYCPTCGYLCLNCAQLRRCKYFYSSPSPPTVPTTIGTTTESEGLITESSTITPMTKQQSGTKRKKVAKGLVSPRSTAEEPVEQLPQLPEAFPNRHRDGAVLCYKTQPEILQMEMLQFFSMVGSLVASKDDLLSWINSDLPEFSSLCRPWPPPTASPPHIPPPTSSSSLPQPSILAQHR